MGGAHRSVRATTRRLNAKTLTYFSQNEGEQMRMLRQRLHGLASSANRYTDWQIHQWYRARLLFDKEAQGFNASFLAALERQLNDEIETVLRDSDRRNPLPGQAPPPEKRIALSLVGAQEMDRKLLRDDVVKKFNTRYEDALTPLTLRLRGLFASDQASLQGNPYRPEILVSAFTAALKEHSFDEDEAQAVLMAFDPQYTIELAPLYAELEHILEQAGVTAQTLRLRKTRAISDGGVRSGGAEDSAFAPLSGFPRFMPGMAMPGYGYSASGWGAGVQARDFLRSLGLGSVGAGAVLAPAHPGSLHAPTFAGATATQGLSAAAIEPFLVAYLEELQASVIESFGHRGLDLDLGSENVLRAMREQDEFRNASDFDRGTVDALAAVFDYVYSDPQIAPALKLIIGRLQIPVLKAALLDRNFFSSPNHPARKLIDALSAAAMAWSQDQGVEDPLYLQIEACVKRVLLEFDEDLALFADVLLEFEEFLVQAEQQAKHQIEPLANAQETQEALDAARSRADDALHERIVGLPEEVSAFLLPFLTQQWREVLALAYLQLDSQPELWPQLLRTTDQLLWSTQHKRDSDERRQLVMVLPDLVRQLNASLDSLEWDASERERFTRRLIAAHMEAIRSSPQAVVPKASDALEQLSGDEAVGELNLRRAAAQVLEPGQFDAMAQGVERGAWFNYLREDEQTLRCRLTWVSPKRTRFLFTNREGFDAFVRSQSEVMELLRTGRLRLLEVQPIVARAIDQIMADPDPATAA